MNTLLLLLLLLFSLLFLYPYVFYPLLLRLMPEHKTVKDIAVGGADHTRPTVSPSCSLLFCAYNEEQSLPKKIANIRELKDRIPTLQVFAYSDCSDDQTNELLRAASDVLTPVIGTERLGKVLGMQKLVGMATSEVLIFTDANVMVDPDSLPKLVAYFEDPEIGAVAGTLLYDELKSDAEEIAVDGDGSVVAQVGGFYWRLEEYIKMLESRSGSMMGADGALFARRRLGYPLLPADLVDDMGVSMDAIFSGLRCVTAPDVYGYEESVQSSSEEFRRKRRIACGSYSTYRHMRSQLREMSSLNRFKFVSHKLLRWWGAFFIIAAFICFLGLACSFGMGLLGLGFSVLLGLALFFGAKAQIGPLLTLYEILAAIAATGIGVLESLLGATYKTWTPAQTRQ